ncbi:uncharacterized protein [Aegilops tauschii subsp. strangulata]|uniref:uncharacterized protein isoform X1 n=1 Tax=Aegilops tauschii subsp. strangulata TaxID=200361 RepID=UPI001ABD04FC|nr:uncharacterized protein LOC109753788 isoform X1 [Aegilops tauschii subsp. strangulata]
MAAPHGCESSHWAERALSPTQVPITCRKCSQFIVQMHHFFVILLVNLRPKMVVEGDVAPSEEAEARVRSKAEARVRSKPGRAARIVVRGGIDQPKWMAVRRRVLQTVPLSEILKGLLNANHALGTMTRRNMMTRASNNSV